MMKGFDKRKFPTKFSGKESPFIEKLLQPKGKKQSFLGSIYLFQKDHFVLTTFTMHRNKIKKVVV